MPQYDQSGRPIQTQDNKPPVAGSQVKILSATGPVSATMVGGNAVKNK
jgi:hypothetical protein